MQSAQIISCSKVIALHSLSSKQAINIYTPHKGLINSVHINHTNKVIASCGQDGRIVLVNAQKPDNEVFDTRFHDTPTVKPISINCIMFSSHSHYIAAGSSDSLIKIWDMKNHKTVFSTIKSHVSSVSSLAWIKNHSISGIQGQLLASSSSIGTIYLHSIKNSNIVQTFNSTNQQCINQIKVSQSEGHCRLAACTGLGSVMIWDMRNIHKTTQPLCQFNNNKKSSITSVSFSSFNPVLLAACSVDENLTFYDINEKKSVKTINSQEPLTSINFHSDGHTLVAGGMYGGLFLYDLRKPNKIKEKLISHETAVKCTEFIKEYDPNTMAASRSSKASSSAMSIASSNAAKIQSSKSIGGSKGTLSRPTEPLQEKKEGVRTNNYMADYEKQKETLNVKVGGGSSSNYLGEKEITPKISSIGQQAINNSQNANIYSKPTTASSAYSNQNNTAGNMPPPPSSKGSGYQYYDNKPQSNTSITPPIKSSNSIPPNVTFNNQPIKASQQSNSDIKDFISDKIQNLHMQLIHQFHQQHIETRNMINDILMRSKEKDNQIIELKKRIAKLESTTY